MADDGRPKSLWVETGHRLNLSGTPRDIKALREVCGNGDKSRPDGDASYNDDPVEGGGHTKEVTDEVSSDPVTAGDPSVVRHKEKADEQRPGEVDGSRTVTPVNIPGTLDEISRALEQHPDHPGLLAAYESLSNNRHPYAATLLLLGVSGTGKSSIINTLFGGTIANTGNKSLVSKTNVEYKISVPMKDIGVSNSTLTIVDTPGFGENERESFEAQILASLDQYLRTEHQNALTCIIITARFDDMRFSGENSPFVIMLKAFKSLKERATILQDSSVVFVLTRLMNAPRKDRSAPQGRVEQFAAVIREYTSWADPIILLAENEAEDRDLKKNPDNDYYILPNGEEFPVNIFKGIQNAIVTRDPMGEAIVRSVYKDVNKFEQPIENEFQLVSKTDRAVILYKGVLEENKMVVQSNVVNQTLAKAWEDMTTSGECQMDEGVVKKVQRAFQKHDIGLLERVPKSDLEVMKLAQDFPRNSEVIFLVKRAFGMDIPRLKMERRPGHCFHMVTGTFSTSRIFLDDEDASVHDVLGPLGFCVSSNLNCFRDDTKMSHCYIFQTEEIFYQKRLEDFGIKMKTKGLDHAWSEFAQGYPKGYNVQLGPDGTATTDSLSEGMITAIREFRLFKLSLMQNALQFKPEFTASIDNLPPFDSSATDGPASSVQAYQNFFKTYGTHVITSCYGGGSVEITAKRAPSAQFHPDEFSGIRTRFEGALNQMFPMQKRDPDGPETKLSDLSKGFIDLQRQFDITIRFNGGNALNGYTFKPCHPKDCEDEGDKPGQWHESILDKPIMFETNFESLPLSEFVRKVNPQMADQIRKAAEHLFDLQVTPDQHPTQVEEKEQPTQSAQANQSNPRRSDEQAPSKQGLFQTWADDFRKMKCNLL